MAARCSAASPRRAAPTSSWATATTAMISARSSRFVAKLRAGYDAGHGQPLPRRHRAGRDAGAAPLSRQSGAVDDRPHLLPQPVPRFPLRPARLPPRRDPRPRSAGARHGVRQRDGRQGDPRASFAITEVPTTLSPDGRTRPPHLRSWRDGWRHLRFLLLFSPRWLFLYPGCALFLTGLAAMAWLLPGPRSIGRVDLRHPHAVLCVARGRRSAPNRCCSGSSPRFTARAKASCRKTPISAPGSSAFSLEAGPDLRRRLGARPASRLAIYALSSWDAEHFGPLSATSSDAAGDPVGHDDPARLPARRAARSSSAFSTSGPAASRR